MTTPSIPPRRLRSALEFAVLMAGEGRKFKPPMAFPKGLGTYMKMARIPTAALPAVARLVESDSLFLSRVSAGAVPELVDPIGVLWLQRPDGWEAAVQGLVAGAEATDEAKGAADELKRSERRRVAAEQTAARARLDVVALQERFDAALATIDDLRADVTKLDDSIVELRAELVDTRLDARHARDREASASARLQAAERARDDAQTALGVAEHVRDDALVDRAASAAEHGELARLAASARTLADGLAGLAAPSRPGPARRSRRPLPLPGGTVGDSRAAGEFLLRSGAAVLVDGYNVAKLAWPSLDLADQRLVLLDALENLTRRFGCHVTAVFDGADVVGATADGRRAVRVVYSPTDVTADDVIRDEVRHLPVTRHVVVVTSDREIVRDVRAEGSNTMSSRQLLDLLR